MTDRHNLPPADELAVVRASRKELEERERVLRQLMISDPSARTGNAHVAEITEIEKPHLDQVELRKMYPDQVAEHTHAVKELHVVIKDLDPDTGEITSARRKPLRTLRIV